MKIRLLKDYGDHKTGECFIVQSDEDAQKLIDKDIAEKDIELETAEKEKAQAEEVAKAVKEAVEKEVEVIKVAAVAIDHDKEEASPYENFGDFLHDVKKCKVDNRMTEDMILYDKMQGENQKAITGMGTIVNTDGGYLVPEDFSTALLTQVAEQAVIVPRTAVIPINNTIKLPYIDDFDKSVSWFGGVTVAWGSEGGTLSASKLAIKQVDLHLNKVHALCYVTDELMDDSAIALGTYLNMAAGISLAKEHDEMVINGSGAGQPLGIVNAACCISVAKTSGQTAATITNANILKMWMRQVNPANCVWLINRDCLEQIYTMSVDGSGASPIMISTNAIKGGSQPLVETIYGRPIIWSEHQQTLGTVGDIMCVDLSAYLTVVKAGQSRIKTASSIHVAFTTDQIAFKFTMRVDGQPWWYKARTVKHGSNTVSPFIKLDTRG